jgi:hypothetical protein
LFYGIIGEISTKSLENVILDRVGTILSHIGAAILDFQFWLVLILQEDLEAVISRPIRWILDNFSIFIDFSKLFSTRFFTPTHSKTFVKTRK